MFDIAHHPEPETPPNIFIEVIIKKHPIVSHLYSGKK